MIVKVEKILNLAKHTHVVDVLIHSFNSHSVASYVCHSQFSDEVSHDPWMLNICCFCGTP